MARQEMNPTIFAMQKLWRSPKIQLIKTAPLQFLSSLEETN